MTQRIPKPSEMKSRKCLKINEKAKKILFSPLKEEETYKRIDRKKRREGRQQYYKIVKGRKKEGRRTGEKRYGNFFQENNQERDFGK